MRTFHLFICLFVSLFQSFASDTIHIKETQIPVLTDRKDNALFYLRIHATSGQSLDNIYMTIEEEAQASNIQSLKLYYGGTEAIQKGSDLHFAPVSYISRDIPGKTREANKSYSVLLSEVKNPSSEVVFKCNKALYPGVNYFWVSVEMKPETPLLGKFTSLIHSVTSDKKELFIENHTPKNIVHRMGIGVRHAGDDGVAAYRIPGLVTTKKGSLLGVYDVRYNNSADLQEYVDIGISRSTDKGNTWEKMRIAMSFGEKDGMPKAQNGVGDPAILVDQQTGTIWVIAAWTQGMGNGRAWFNSQEGMDKSQTAQLMLTRSDDDGVTWSEPINITEQVKDPSWHFLLQGPGMGITMRDGTLVFAAQYIDADKIPNACILYSKDRGNTWHLHSPARSNTTEAQVAEIEPGVLMLNMRDNRGGHRAVSITKDLGKTWTEHPSSGKLLQEPVCMASLIQISAKDNVLGKDLLLFSNPNTQKGRNHITIKASLDRGVTFPSEYHLMLDEGEGWGYSCLTLIDNETVGILYESSTAHMTFQSIKIKDIIREEKDIVSDWSYLDEVWYEEHVSYTCKDGTLHFLTGRIADDFKDTLIVRKCGKETTLIEIDDSETEPRMHTEDLRYFDPSIYTFGTDSFYLVFRGNGGNSNYNEVRMYHINPSDGSLKRVKVINAQDTYSRKVLKKNQFFWDDEYRTFDGEHIYSKSYIWNDPIDSHCCPTGGKMIAQYELVKKRNGDFILRPTSYQFIPYNPEEDN